MAPTTRSWSLLEWDRKVEPAGLRAEAVRSTEACSVKVMFAAKPRSSALVTNRVTSVVVLWLRQPLEYLSNELQELVGCCGLV